MRCFAWVKVETRRQKGSGKEYEHVRAVKDGYARMQSPISHEEQMALFRARKPQPPQVPTIWFPTPPEPGLERCGGTIIADVKAVDEPYYGGNSAMLEVSCTCTRCKWTYHGPKLDTTPEGVSQMLTDYIAQLPDVPD